MTVTLRFFPRRFANPEVFPHHCCFVCERGTVPSGNSCSKFIFSDDRMVIVQQ
jgi:hypothetical protein